ncbi:hypothetical protein TKK_0011771 [Trichogramma kaykai]|uniref:SHSP domain-containing protein n=1 Tax=Trichogramma kaykai TaxID=54128 RepID=A0ABD2WQ77_9HYME
MSLVPLMFSDWWQDLDQPHRILDQEFGHGLHPEQLVCPNFPSLGSYLVPPHHQPKQRVPYLRPWGEIMRKHEGGGTSTVKNDKDRFQVVLDVKQFKPEEINVKIVGKFVVVEGKHDETQDEHGWISRQFTRKYLIPEQCDVDQVSSSLSSDGVLSITAPRKDQHKNKDEKPVKIQFTGKPAINDVPKKMTADQIHEETPAKKK